MGKTSPRGVLHQALLTIVCVGMVTLQACSVAHSLHGKPGLDLASIRPGMTRSDVDAILGAPIRGWQSPSGIRYEVYKYDPGVPPNVGEAGFFAFMDVVSLGIWEIGMLSHDQPLIKPQKKQIAISFDSEDRVLGVFPDFGDFDVLPADGRATPNGPRSPH